MSHKHDKTIRKTLELWPNVAMFTKLSAGGQWELYKLKPSFPPFCNDREYAVVPSRHKDIAHAYFVEGKELEIWCPAPDGYWADVGVPSFSSSATYRIKPELPERYWVGDKFLINEGLYIIAATGGAEAAAINMHTGMRFDNPLHREEGDLRVSATSLAEHLEATEQELFEARVDVTTSYQKVK